MMWRCALRHRLGHLLHPAPPLAGPRVGALEVSGWREVVAGMCSSSTAAAAAAPTTTTTKMATEEKGAESSATAPDSALERRNAHIGFRKFGQVDQPIAIAPKDEFVVVQLGSQQFKVTPDDLILCEKLHGVDINDQLVLSRVLLWGSKDETLIGQPLIDSVRVEALVEEHFKGGKVWIFKKKKRKNYRRFKGFRPVVNCTKDP